MLTSAQFYNKYRDLLCLEICVGEKGLTRFIKVPEIERPGLTLSGFLKGHSFKRILVFGKVEMAYLKELDVDLRTKRLDAITSSEVPLIVVTRKLQPFSEMVSLCDSKQIPLFRTSLTTSDVLRKLTIALADEFAPEFCCHGTLVETFGVGVLIQGDSSVGKSETALGLIERGHRLISDDVVMIKKNEAGTLVGFGPELTRHMLEIRGIGIINVAHLYGAVCISERAKIDLVVNLEEWDDKHFYDRVGIEEKYLDILGVKIQRYLLPVKTGRDVVLLLETIVLNHRLKKMGYHSAKEFNNKLLETISKRQSLIV